VARTLTIEDKPARAADVVQMGNGRHLIHEYAAGVKLFAVVN
jgi:hypothetical protein